MYGFSQMFQQENSSILLMQQSTDLDLVHSLDVSHYWVL